ncbi:NAD-dependent epimerase/dehydratase family protein [uncultured Psychromonas sp.]|uniref:NAD-dependent epimerase/dehydratase family protein n=1 Tax=uncultured Psychromonas sp. TaxID=173974 RepID=UPI0026167F4D|nr:NAD-dependent epimerase/dehydratase family protein [uncultured Psychromonas sp.]
MDKKKRTICLLLGASGFIGSHTVEYLSKEFSLVISLSRNWLNPKKYLNVKYISGDFYDTEFMNSLLDGVDCVVNMITTTTPISSNLDPVLDIKENLIGNVEFIKLCAVNNVKKYIFISSGGTIYGDPCPTDGFNEYSPTNPSSSYGIVKLAFEKYMRHYEEKYGISAISIRVSNPYGLSPKINPEQGLISNILFKSLNNMPIEIWGDGTNTRDYIAVEDVARAVIKVCQYEGPERVFNIGTSIGYSINDVIALVSDLRNEPLEVIYKYSDTKSGVAASVLDCTLAKRELNWSHEVSLKKGVTELYAYHHKKVN